MYGRDPVTEMITASITPRPRRPFEASIACPAPARGLEKRGAAARHRQRRRPAAGHRQQAPKRVASRGAGLSDGACVASVCCVGVASVCCVGVASVCCAGVASVCCVGVASVCCVCVASVCCVGVASVCCVCVASVCRRRFARAWLRLCGARARLARPAPHLPTSTDLVARGT